MNQEALTSILIKKKNSFFRKSDDVNNNGYIHDQQINTARKIVLQLGSNILRSNHVNLVSPMQAGKTSVCNAVVNVILQTKLYKSMMVKKFMFISGMNDCGLKDQTYTRLIEQVIGANVDNVYFGKRSKKKLFCRSDDNAVYWLDNGNINRCVVGKYSSAEINECIRIGNLWYVCGDCDSPGPGRKVYGGVLGVGAGV